MKVKVLSTQHSGGTLYLTGSFRELPDLLAKELIDKGLVEEVLTEKVEVKEIKEKVTEKQKDNGKK